MNMIMTKFWLITSSIYEKSELKTAKQKCKVRVVRFPIDNNPITANRTQIHVRNSSTCDYETKMAIPKTKNAIKLTSELPAKGKEAKYFV